ncbi:SDR family oxidoreductase (plasmid) [Sinorhizobium meliloti]|nr:SDR family oxidoreductase [Sinorhizobium meliloti]
MMNGIPSSTFIYGALARMPSKSIPHMAKKGGSIVNISSDRAVGSIRAILDYSAAKSGLVGLTRTIVIEQSRNNVRVNAVAPGPVLTPMVEAVPEEVRKGWLANTAQARGETGGVASVIAFLLSDDASYVTGQVVGINGGSAI